MFAFFKSAAMAPIAAVLAALIVLTPISHAVAQAGTGCMDGEMQAERDISAGTWFAIGCLAGLIGYLIAMQEPNPPATALIGKEPEYVAAYTDCYRRKGKSIKTKNALTGCLVANAATLAIYVILLATVDWDEY